MQAPSPWQTLTAAPHRPMFLAGAVQAVLALAWWLADLLGRYGGLYPPLPTAVPSLWAHGFLMLYGFFPFFIFGFLMTAAPRWVNGEEVARRHYLPAFLLMAVGVALFYPALFLGRPALALAVMLLLAGWLTGWNGLRVVVRRSTHPDKRHAYTVIGVVLVGAVGAASYLLWLLSDAYWLLRLAITGGVWLFLLPTFVSVSHRMIPFFSASILPNHERHRPYWALFALLGGMALHTLLELSGLHGWLWLADLPMAAVAFHLSHLWGFGRSFGADRLLTVVHIGFAWLGIALSLYALQSLLQLAGHYVLGTAPLHALTIGYFSSMLLAMASRVTLGHSGRPLSADRATWRLFLAFQAVPLLRIAGDLPLPGAAHFYLAAALVWLVCFIMWGIKYVPAYLRPRVDGQPG